GWRRPRRHSAMALRPRVRRSFASLHSPFTPALWPSCAPAGPSSTEYSGPIVARSRSHYGRLGLRGRCRSLSWCCRLDGPKDREFHPLTFDDLRISASYRLGIDRIPNRPACVRCTRRSLRSLTCLVIERQSARGDTVPLRSHPVLPCLVHPLKLSGT